LEKGSIAMDAQQKAFYRRLVEDGRWNEAFQWKEERRRQLRENGLSREEANSQAWAEMVERYSPDGSVVATAGDGDQPGPPAADPSQAPADSSETASVSGDESEAVCEYPTPSGDGDFAGDVRWAYSQYSRVVIQAPGKPARCDFSRATSPPPSGGAVGLMVWASENRTAFFKDLVPKSLNIDDNPDEKKIAEETRSIGEVHDVLEAFNRDFERQLAEDAPGALQDAVRRSLSDWQGLSGVELPAEARASLEAHVTDLCNRVRTASHSHATAASS